MSPVISSNKYTAIVVGAGVAGLAACRTLINGGIKNILLLEGQGQAGGRVSSVPICGSATTDVRWLELGAQWLHGQNSKLYSIANSNNLVTDITSAEGLGQYLCENGDEVEMKIVAEVANVVGDILEDCEQFWLENEKDVPASVGEYLNERFQQYLNECDDPPKIRQIKMNLYDWHIRFQVIDNSCNDLNDLSAKSWGRYKFCGGTDYINFKMGYSSLIDCLVNELPNETLKLNTPVSNIKYEGSLNLINNNYNINETAPATLYPVTVTCEDGTEYHCSHAIVTSSLGYLKAHHKTMFKPVLPSKIYKSIENIGFAVINKIFLCYDRPWWTNDQYGFQIIWSSSSNKDHEIKRMGLLPEQMWMKDLSGFDVLPNVEGVLLGWIGRNGAIAFEHLTETQVGEHCTYLLRHFTKRQDIPLPNKVVRSCWHSNRFICGGYSHLTVKCDLLKKRNKKVNSCHDGQNGEVHVFDVDDGCDNAEDDEDDDAKPENLSSPVYVKTQCSTKHPAVLIAGEATHKKYFSTTHGAYETGQFQANRIIRFIKDNIPELVNH